MGIKAKVKSQSLKVVNRQSSMIGNRGIVNKSKVKSQNLKVFQ